MFNNLSSSNSFESSISLVKFNSFWEFANSIDILFNVSLSVFISKLSFEISDCISEELASIFFISSVTELMSLFKFSANSFDLLKSSILNELLIFVNSELYCFWRLSFLSFNKFIWSERGFSFVLKSFISETFWLTVKFLFFISDCKLVNSFFNCSDSPNLAVSSVILELELKPELWPFNSLSFVDFKAIVSVNSNLFPFKLFISSLILLLCDICSFKLLLREDISVCNKTDCSSVLTTSLLTFSRSSFNFSDNSIDFWVSKLDKFSALNFEISRLYWKVNNVFFSFKTLSSELIGSSSLFKFDNSTLLFSIVTVFSWNLFSSSETLDDISLSVITSSPVLVKIEPV